MSKKHKCYSCIHGVMNKCGHPNQPFNVGYEVIEGGQTIVKHCAHYEKRPNSILQGITDVALFVVYVGMVSVFAVINKADTVLSRLFKREGGK